MTSTIEFSPATQADMAQTIALWQAAGLTRPWNDPQKDFLFAIEKPESAVLVGRENGKIVSSVMVGHDGHRGVVYYMAVDPDRQGGGLGRKTMKAAEDWLLDRGVWKMNLLVRDDNSDAQGFYKSLGYSVSPVVSMQRKLVD